MASHDVSGQGIAEQEVFFIETFLRQRGDHKALLAIDALVLRDDLSDAERAAKLQMTIQEAINGG